MNKSILALIFLPLGVCGQQAMQKMDRIFRDDQIKPTVLLLGVFHFGGEQVDADTTPDDLRINMLLPERQRQIQCLVDSLKKFAPNKIAFEGLPKYQKKYDSLYLAYLDNRLNASPKFMAGELVQIGFRLAKEMGLKTLYPVDAQAFRFLLSPTDSITTFDKYKIQRDTSEAYWDGIYGNTMPMTIHFQDFMKHIKLACVNECLRRL